MVDPKYMFGVNFAKRGLLLLVEVKTLGLKVCKKLYISLFLKIKTCKGHIYGAWAEYKIVDDFKVYRA